MGNWVGSFVIDASFLAPVLNAAEGGSLRPHRPPTFLPRRLILEFVAGMLEGIGTQDNAIAGAKAGRIASAGCEVFAGSALRAHFSRSSPAT